ncbi:hypothetical protein LTR28_006378 [Elasticomyces elasticus]|nr:hypothetical protein LTR28_006378 [Elasticomyces elasticus]
MRTRTTSKSAATNGISAFPRDESGPPAVTRGSLRQTYARSGSRNSTSSSSEIVVANYHAPPSTSMPIVRATYETQGTQGLLIVVGLRPEHFPVSLPHGNGDVAMRCIGTNLDRAGSDRGGRNVTPTSTRKETEPVDSAAQPQVSEILNNHKYSPSKRTTSDLRLGEATSVPQRRGRRSARRKREPPAIEEQVISHLNTNTFTMAESEIFDTSSDPESLELQNSMSPNKTQETHVSTPEASTLALSATTLPTTISPTMPPTIAVADIMAPLRMLTEEEDVLTDSDLPPAYLDTPPSSDFDEPDDEAQAIYNQSYKPMPDFNDLIAALRKHDITNRPTSVLWKLAANTNAVLKQWQDEYLELDRITAPAAAIPRKPVRGGRDLVDKTEWEDRKEAALYGYKFDPNKIGFQDPYAQRPVRDNSGDGKRTRAQRNAGLLDTSRGAVTDDDVTVDGKRKRKPVSRYNGIANNLSPRKRDFGTSETPDLDVFAPATRRNAAKPGAGLPMGNRIRELRAESGFTTTTAENDEGEEDEDAPLENRMARPTTEAVHPVTGRPLPPLNSKGNRRGRVKGSKNMRQRSDAGVPKGSRKPTNGDIATPTPATGIAAKSCSRSKTKSATPAIVPAGADDTDSEAGNARKDGDEDENEDEDENGDEDGNEDEDGREWEEPSPDAPTKKKKQRRRQREPNTKRSDSMTKWWQGRKAKLAQQKLDQLRKEGKVIQGNVLDEEQKDGADRTEGVE